MKARQQKIEETQKVTFDTPLANTITSHENFSMEIVQPKLDAFCSIHGLQVRTSLVRDGMKEWAFCMFCLGDFITERFPVTIIKDEEQKDE